MLDLYSLRRVVRVEPGPDQSSNQTHPMGYIFHPMYGIRTLLLATVLSILLLDLFSTSYGFVTHLIESIG